MEVYKCTNHSIQSSTVQGVSPLLACAACALLSTRHPVPIATPTLSFAFHAQLLKYPYFVAAEDRPSSASELVGAHCLELTILFPLW